MSSIERESIEVENAREVVAANEHKANEAATKAQALKVPFYAFYAFNLHPLNNGNPIQHQLAVPIVEQFLLNNDLISQKNVLSTSLEFQITVS